MPVSGRVIVFAGVMYNPVMEAAPVATPSPLDILRGTFGFDSFRPGQEKIIGAVLAGKDCIGVMPTGAG